MSVIRNVGGMHTMGKLGMYFKNFPLKWTHFYAFKNILFTYSFIWSGRMTRELKIICYPWFTSELSPRARVWVRLNLRTWSLMSVSHADGRNVSVWVSLCCLRRPRSVGSQAEVDPGTGFSLTITLKHSCSNVTCSPTVLASHTWSFYFPRAIFTALF